MILSLLALLAAPAWAEPITANVNEKAFDVVVHLTSPDQFAVLKPLELTVVDRSGGDFRLLASDDEIAYLEAQGYDVEVLGPAEVEAPDGYHNYASGIADLEDYAATYPALTRLIDLGQSVEGKRIVALKISDHAADSEAEPGIVFDGAIHGDEAIGAELCFAFISYLLDNYGDDPAVTALVDDNEIFVVPMMNPDNLTQARGNANGIDMNRNYPFFWEGTGAWTGAPETRAIMGFVMDVRPMLYINYHAGATLVNYNWDGVYTLSPDNDLEIAMSQVYAGPSGYGITNGAQWYIADGTTEDWVHGTDGATSVIVELSGNKMPPQSAWQDIFNKNIPTMIA
jgi:hypothetical protein